MKITHEEASALLKAGHLVSLPTETVYGLAACLNQPDAIKNIFKLKGRPLNNPLIIHLCHAKQVEEYRLDHIPKFYELASAFWPGPLTMVVPVDTQKIPTIVRANLSTAAFRIPNHTETLKVIEQAGPLVMPSANLSGSPSATMASHVEKDFGSDFPVLDGGICKQGLESTILYYFKSTWVILRLGALTAEALEPVLGYQPDYYSSENDQTQPIAPGQLLRHYAPKAKLIVESFPSQQEVPFIIGFKERAYPVMSSFLSLGSINNPEEVAVNLYHILRELDLKKASWAWVDMDFPNDGLWKVIRERLLRASQNV